VKATRWLNEETGRVLFQTRALREGGGRGENDPPTGAHKSRADGVFARDFSKLKQEKCNHVRRPEREKNRGHRNAGGLRSPLPKT